MRLQALLAGAAMLAFAHGASAVTLSAVSYSPEFQTALDDELGAREGAHLSAAVTEAVEAALAARGASVGASGGSIELSIVDADPNRPTMQQLIERPSLDSRSISIGGAELRAVIRSADGQVLEEVNYRRYDHSLSDLQGAATTWTGAHRAIRRFANRVADAYVANVR